MHKGQGRIIELDGLRGIAVLLVVLHHYLYMVTPTTIHTWQAYALVPLRLCWSGVDLFFVLSGFLVGGILHDARHATNYYRVFYMRRLHRIAPLQLLWLGLYLAGMWATARVAGGPLYDLFHSPVPVWAYFVAAQTFYIPLLHAFGSSWVMITWSLAVEEQFYLLLPALVRRLSTRGLGRVMVFALVAAPLARMLYARYDSPFFGAYTQLWCRMDTLGVGVLLALAYRHERIWGWLAARRGAVAVAGVVLAAGAVGFLLNLQHVIVFGISWLAVFYAAIIALALLYRGEAAVAILRSRLLTGLGAVSYAVYLSHTGLNALLHYAVFGRKEQVTGWATLGVTVLSLCLVLVLSWLSGRFLEQPLIARAHARYRYAFAPDGPAVRENGRAAGVGSFA